MAEDERRRSNSSTANGFSISSIVRSLEERSEADRPFIPLVGGPRLFILLLYASVLIATSIEFFVGIDIWYGTWNLYNSFVFVISGVFVFLGMVMVFSYRRTEVDDYNLPINRDLLGLLGFAMLAASGILLVLYGRDAGGWAVLLSVTLLYGFVFMLFSVRGMGMHDAYRLGLYGTGIILMILVPVHEAFNVGRSDPSNFLVTLPNLILLTVGMTFALVAVQSLQTRNGYVGAWLMGAMGIFLIAFHEQLGIVASRTYSQYDRTLALIGITFSFLPLALYVWREKVYIFLWSRLRSANALIESGDYKGALLHADASIRQCSHAGIEDRFALPWSLKADSHYRMKEYEKARVFYETALKIDAKDAVSWSHMGNMYAFEGKQEQALKAFDEAIKVDPKNPEAWNNKGAVYQSLKMHEDALICFDKAISFDPRNFDAHINKARLLARLGHSNEALPEYQAALALRPDSQDARNGLQKEFFRGKCLDQIDGWEQFGLDISSLRSILDEDPSNFVKKSKEFLAKIVDEQEQLRVVPSTEHIDVNAAIKNILRATEGEGATLEKLVEETGLSKHHLILPLALLMETDHVHFKSVGKKEVYVSRGKAPDKPPEPPPPPPPPPIVKKAARRPPRPKIRKPKILRREKQEIPEPTASILIFKRKK